MIISKKKYKKDIEEAVAKALQEADERRWMYQRIDDLDNSTRRRMDSLDERIFRLEQQANISSIKVTDEVAIRPTSCR